MIINSTCTNPEAIAGETKAGGDYWSNLRCLGDKRAVAGMVGMSHRWVDQQLTKGMPHLKVGNRRVRFDLDEVRAWLKDKYGTRRRGPAAKPYHTDVAA